MLTGHSEISLHTRKTGIPYIRAVQERQKVSDRVKVVSRHQNEGYWCS
jgi:hypothetical protein